ncbi:unnamed protein product [Rhizophagus irregularis]|nr:unnamed protein product [Rhizophagus irregularis]
MITTDNGSNMRKAIKDLELAAENIMWQPCTAHTLQLVVEKDLAPIKSLVGHAKRLIDFFMSPKQSERLEKIQKQFIQPNSNSSSRTPICQLLELKGYIRTLEANLAEETDQDSKKDSQRLTKVMLTNDEWDLLRDLIFILGPFEETTGILELKPDEPNENTMNINIENLEDVFVWNEDQDNSNNPNNEKNTNEHQKNVDLNQPMQISGVLKKVKDTLYQAMLFYWKNEREISYLPSILDPRIKKLDFAPYEIEQTLNSLKNKYRKMKLSMSSHLQSSPIPMPVTITTPFLGPTPSSTLYKSTLFDIFNHPSPANNRNELNEYLAIPQIPFNIDPFSWWKINKEKFPILSELARAYLSVSATSTPKITIFWIQFTNHSYQKTNIM